MEQTISLQIPKTTSIKTCLIFNENFDECGLQKIKLKQITLSPPMKVQQVRIPRTNLIVHPSLPKIKNQYLENNFFIEVFGKEFGTTKYDLLCSQEINTQKDIQDIVIAINNEKYFDSIIIKGDLDNKNHVVLYAEKEPFMEQEIDIQEERVKRFENLKKKVQRVVSENLSELIELEQNQDFQFLNKYLKTQNKEFQEQNWMQIFNDNFDYKHLWKILEEQDKEDYLKEVQINKTLRDSVKQIDAYINNSNSQDEVIFYKLQLTKVEDALNQFFQMKKSSFLEPCLVVNNYKDELKQELNEIVSKALEGKIDFSSEILQSMQILKILLNKQEDINKLLRNKDFLRNFFMICFSVHKTDFTIQSVFLTNLYHLLFYKKFRDGLLMKGQVDEEICYFDIIKSFMDTKFIIPLEKEDPNIIKKRKTKEDDQEHKKSKKKSKKENDDWDTSSEDEVQNQENQDFLDDMIKDACIEQVDFQKGKTISLFNAYQITIKIMLTQENPLLFQIWKDFNSVMGVVQYIRETKIKLKSLIEYSKNVKNFTQNEKNKYATKIDYVDSLENIEYYIKKIFLNLKLIIEANQKTKHQTSKAYELIQSQMKEYIKDKEDFFPKMVQEAKYGITSLTYFISNIIQEEQLLEIFLLVLNNSVIKTSHVANEIQRTIFNTIYYLLSCQGGFNIISSNYKIFEDLKNVLKSQCDSFQFDIRKLGEYKIENVSQFGQLICFDSQIQNQMLQQHKQAINQVTLIKSLKLYHLIDQMVQVYFLMLKIHQAVKAPQKSQELLYHLCSLDTILKNSLISKQAVYMVVKEPYMYDIFILLLNISSPENYSNFKNEINLTLSIINEIQTFDTGNLMINHNESLKKSVQVLRKYQREFQKLNPQHILEKNNQGLEKQLVILEKSINSLQDCKMNFQIFVNTFSRVCRYTILDISTYLKKDFKFSSLIDLIFPFGNKKQLFSRFNIYLDHFKTQSDKDSPIHYILSVIKFISVTLTNNPIFFKHIIESNIFDMVDHICQVCELLLTIHQEKSCYGRQLRECYKNQTLDILTSYIDLIYHCIHLLRQKIIFKDTLLQHSMEYENFNLFQSLLRLMKIISQLNPYYFYEEIINRIFELGEVKRNYKKQVKFSLKHFNLLESLEHINLIKENEFRLQFYLKDVSKGKINDIIYELISMFKYWAKFPGSIIPLVSELIFQIFNGYQERYVYMLILSLLMNETRRIRCINNSKSKFINDLKPLLFEHVKTKKKSTLVLIQKYGACKSDSQFDLFVTKNGFNTTIDYLLNTFIFESDNLVFKSFFIFIQSLLEWKDFEYSEKIYRTIEKILRIKVDNLKTIFLNNSISPKIIHLFKNISRVFNFTYLLCSSAIFKKLLINESYISSCFIFFTFCFENKGIQEKYENLFLNAKIEFLKLFEILCDANINMHYKKKMGKESTEKLYNEIIMSRDLERFLQEIFLKFIEPTEFIASYFKGNLKTPPNQTQQQELLLFNRSIILLSKLVTNPKGQQELFTLVWDEEQQITQISCLNGLFMEIFSYYKDKKDRKQTEIECRENLVEFIKVFNIYLNTVFQSLINQEQNYAAVFKNRKNLVKSLYFKGQKVTHVLARFRESIEMFTNVEQIQNDLFNIKIILVGIEKYFERKSLKEKEKMECSEYKVNLKKFFDDYNKSYFIYDQNLGEFLRKSNQRFQNDNAFMYLKSCLQNKFSKTMLPRNFGKNSLIKNYSYWMDYEYKQNELETYYKYPLVFCTNELLNQVSNTIMSNFINVLQDNNIHIKSVHFFHPQQITRNLSIKELMIRSQEEQIQNIIKPIAPQMNLENVTMNYQNQEKQMQNFVQEPQIQMVQNGQMNYDQYMGYQMPTDQMYYGGDSYTYGDVSQQAYMQMFNQMMTDQFYMQNQIDPQQTIPEQAPQIVPDPIQMQYMYQNQYPQYQYPNQYPPMYDQFPNPNFYQDQQMLYQQMMYQENNQMNYGYDQQQNQKNNRGQDMRRRE